MMKSSCLIIATLFFLVASCTSGNRLFKEEIDYSNNLTVGESKVIFLNHYLDYYPDGSSYVDTIELGHCSCQEGDTNKIYLSNNGSMVLRNIEIQFTKSGFHSVTSRIRGDFGGETKVFEILDYEIKYNQKGNILSGVINKAFLERDSLKFELVGNFKCGSR